VFLSQGVRVQQIAMIAKDAFQHDGRQYAAGECFRVAPIVALSFKYRRLATFASVDEARAHDADVLAQQAMVAAPVRRRYRRRDMVAE
jgi:hypothetical protein